MSLGGTAFTELCVKELELCGVHEGEVMAVLSQGDERLDYCDAFLAAATQLGATAFHVRLPTESPTLSGDVGSWTVGATPLAGNRPAVEAIKSADILIDTMFLLFSQGAARDPGGRHPHRCSCIEPIEHLIQLFPTPELRERVEYGEHLLGNARSLRFTNAAGHRRHLQARRLPASSPSTATPTPRAAGTTGLRASCSPAAPTTASTARWCSPPATSSSRSRATCRRRSRSRSSKAASSTSAASSTPTS